MSMDRRQFLWQAGGGLGGVALAQLLGDDGLLAAGPHHKARARRVIQLFMNGGASQCDTFDYKPELNRLHGQKFDPGGHVEAATSVPGQVLRSPWSWKQHGECGRWVSSAFPHVAA